MLRLIFPSDDSQDTKNTYIRVFGAVLYEFIMREKSVCS